MDSGDDDDNGGYGYGNHIGGLGDGGGLIGLGLGGLVGGATLGLDCFCVEQLPNMIISTSMRSNPKVILRINGKKTKFKVCQ